jgi:hypothetical protein
MTDAYKTITYLTEVVAAKFEMPPQGAIILFGHDPSTGSLQHVCDRWGDHRCEAYDITPNPHPCHTEWDLRDCDALPTRKIAFADIDVGRWSTHWPVRLQCLKWSVPLMVEGGMIQCASPSASSQWGDQGHAWMMSQGFSCHPFSQYAHESWHQHMHHHTQWYPNGTCIYRKEPQHG